MAWKVALDDGVLAATYAGSAVLEGVSLWSRMGGAEIPLVLEPYGRPYTVEAPAGEQVISHFSLVPDGEGPEGVLLEVGAGPRRLYLRLYPIGAWWDYVLRSQVCWGQEPYPCRTEAGGPHEVVQSGLGHVDSRLCDCLFDKWGDRLLRFGVDGELQTGADPVTGARSVETRVRTTFGSIPEMLSAQVTEHFVTEHRGMPHYVPYDRTRHPLPPSGWESWYCYDRSTSEEILVTITDWLRENLKPFGCSLVQWDDGYQDASWLEWRQDLFPHGPRWIVDYVHAAGFAAGIWVLPQSLGHVDSRYLQTKPEWVLRDPEGEVFRRFGNYPYVDPTHPETQRDWFGKIFRTMAREWGIDFFKIDGEGEMQQWYALCRDQLFDPEVTPDEAYRNWLAIIRQAIGPERSLLICATQWRAMGYGDACRTGTDVGERWPSVERALQATFSNYWMHTIAWYCDPDVLIVRPTLTLDQARAWSSLLGLSGQVLLNSDPVHELPEERVELLRRIFPAQDIRPMDLMSRPPYGPYPQVWDLKVATSWGRWDMVGLFRWFETDGAQIEISATRLGLSPGRYVLYDFWGKEYLGELGTSRTFDLAPGSCLVLCVRPFSGLPQLLGTNRHISQYGDLLDLRWDAERGVLSGESLVVGGDTYEIRVLVEGDGVRWVPEAAFAEGAAADLVSHGPVLALTLGCDTSRQVSWQVRLHRREDDAAATDPA